MLIINADDWGRSKADTDSAMSCHAAGRITSISAMVFMADSKRAAEMAKEAGIDVGLHLNLSENFDGGEATPDIVSRHNRICRFLCRSKYALLVYNPLLRRAFRDVCRAQMQEFERLYGQPPSHIDGHQHMHLCSNVLLDRLLPAGARVRRSFSFWPGEKSGLNRAYRRWVDRKLTSRCRTTDYFFSIEHCIRFKRLARVVELAKKSNVELMTHPRRTDEYECLMGEPGAELQRDLRLGSFALL